MIVFFEIIYIFLKSDIKIIIKLMNNYVISESDIKIIIKLIINRDQTTSVRYEKHTSVTN